MRQRSLRPGTQNRLTRKRSIEPNQRSDTARRRIDARANFRFRKGPAGTRHRRMLRKSAKGHRAAMYPILMLGSATMISVERPTESFRKNSSVRFLVERPMTNTITIWVT